MVHSQFAVTSKKILVDSSFIDVGQLCRKELIIQSRPDPSINRLEVPP